MLEQESLARLLIIDICRIVFNQVIHLCQYVVELLNEALFVFLKASDDLLDRLRVPVV